MLNMHLTPYELSGISANETLTITLPNKNTFQVTFPVATLDHLEEMFELHASDLSWIETESESDLQELIPLLIEELSTSTIHVTADGSEFDGVMDMLDKRRIRDADMLICGQYKEDDAIYNVIIPAIAFINNKAIIRKMASDNRAWTSQQHWIKGRLHAMPDTALKQLLSQLADMDIATPSAQKEMDALEVLTYQEPENSRTQTRSGRRAPSSR